MLRAGGSSTWRFAGRLYCQTSMTQPTGGPSAAPHFIDTKGDASLTAVYAAVVLVEVVVLAALWFFSRYFGA